MFLFKMQYHICTVTYNFYFEFRRINVLRQFLSVNASKKTKKNQNVVIIKKSFNFSIVKKVHR